MSRIKEYPSITSFDGTYDALAIEQTDGANNRTRKVTPAQLKQYMEAGDFEATGEVKDGHGNILSEKCNVAVYNWNLGNVTADTVYTLSNFKSTVGLSGKSIIAVGFNFIAGSSDYDYGAETNYRNSADFVRVKVSKTQTNTTVNLYIIYTD